MKNWQIKLLIGFGIVIIVLQCNCSYAWTEQEKYEIYKNAEKLRMVDEAIKQKDREIVDKAVRDAHSETNGSSDSNPGAGLLCCAVAIILIIASLSSQNKAKSDQVAMTKHKLSTPANRTSNSKSSNIGREVKSVSIFDDELKKCPYCAEMIKSEAQFCRYCRKDL